MKIRTTGLLAGISMAVTMVTVWALTPAGGFQGGGDAVERAERLGLAPAALQVAAERWKFEDGSTLRVEGRLGHATLGANEESETFVYLNVRSPVEAQAANAAPVDLAIVIDRSGSMQGKRMQNAIDAARGMVRRLRDGDRVSVITYNTVAETVVPQTIIGPSSREDVVSRLAGIVPSGDTCISCGLEAGMRALEGSFAAAGTVKRMLLLSDGQATAGIRDEQGFRSLAARVRDMGCSISSIGVDVDYNQRIMSTIASESNGRHYFVENAATLPSIFEEEMRSIARLVASDSEMRVSLAPGVQVLEVFDRTFRRDGDTLVVPMGTFAAGEDKTLLVKVRVPRGATGERPVADVALRFRDLQNGGEGACRGSLLASLAADPAARSPLDPLVGARLGRAGTTALLREANDLFERGDVDGARAAIADQRAALRRQRNDLAPAPTGRSGEVEGDFERQDEALARAEGGFAAPPSPARAKPGKAQVRANEQAAADMAF
jgi:Ca-activated chloride channel homolog